MANQIPWDAGARFIDESPRVTPIGTLRGCVRAWQFLAPEHQETALISCDAPAFLDRWLVPTGSFEAADIAQLTMRLP